MKPPIAKYEGKIYNSKTHKAMVLKLHAKESVKIQMTKLLAETIWIAKKVRKNIRKLKNIITNGGQKRTSDQRMNLVQCVGPTCDRRIRSTCAKRKAK